MWLEKYCAIQRSNKGITTANITEIHDSPVFANIKINGIFAITANP